MPSDAEDGGKEEPDDSASSPLLPGTEVPVEETMSARQRRAFYLAMTVNDIKEDIEKRGLDNHSKPLGQLTKDQLIQILMDADSRQKKWVQSKGFELFFGIFVILNALAIGVQIDKPEALTMAGWLVLNLLFLLVFVIETGIKVHVLGWRDYLSDNWNVFDVVVTIMVAVQLSAYYSLFADKFYENWRKYVAADFVQMLRLCRLLRLSRVFNELGVLVSAFLSSLQALGWILLLALIWFYICACLATVFIGRRERLPSEDKEAIQELREKFSTIPISMFGLFEVMTLEGWTDAVRPLLNTRVYLVFFFLWFIFVTAFFILNLVTAVVVDRTVAAQEEMKTSEEKEEAMRRSAYISCIYRVLTEKNKAVRVGEDEDGIEWSNFKDFIKDAEILQCLGPLGWSKEYMESMFDMIDYDGDGVASLSEMKKFLEASHQPLDTANYVRFQINLARRLEFQENITLTMLHALEKVAGKTFELPSSVDRKMRAQSFIKE